MPMSLLQSRQQFRPARITPRADVQGPQTAVVVGPAGDEIYIRQVRTDQGAVPLGPLRQARRELELLDPRVAAWAGKGWGSVSIPRIGQEVIVDFLEGDPDRPIVTGCVYNADNPPPYGLPGVRCGQRAEEQHAQGRRQQRDDPERHRGEGEDHHPRPVRHGHHRAARPDQHGRTTHVHRGRDHNETITGATNVTHRQGPLQAGRPDRYVHPHTKGAVTEHPRYTQETYVANKVMIKSINATSHRLQHQDHLQRRQLRWDEADGAIRSPGRRSPSRATMVERLRQGRKPSSAPETRASRQMRRRWRHGAAISSSATGTHEITGAVVKIN